MDMAGLPTLGSTLQCDVCNITGLKNTLCPRHHASYLKKENKKSNISVEPVQPQNRLQAAAQMPHYEYPNIITYTCETCGQQFDDDGLLTFHSITSRHGDGANESGRNRRRLQLESRSDCSPSTQPGSGTKPAEEADELRRVELESRRIESEWRWPDMDTRKPMTAVNFRCKLCVRDFLSIDAISLHFKESSHKQLHESKLKQLQPIMCVVCNVEGTADVPRMKKHVDGEEHRRMLMHNGQHVSGASFVL